MNHHLFRRFKPASAKSSVEMHHEYYGMSDYCMLHSSVASGGTINIIIIIHNRDYISYTRYFSLHNYRKESTLYC